MLREARRATGPFLAGCVTNLSLEAPGFPYVWVQYWYGKDMPLESMALAY